MVGNDTLAKADYCPKVLQCSKGNFGTVNLNGFVPILWQFLPAGSQPFQVGGQRWDKFIHINLWGNCNCPIGAFELKTKYANWHSWPIADIPVIFVYFSQKTLICHLQHPILAYFSLFYVQNSIAKAKKTAVEGFFYGCSDFFT